MEDIPGSVPTEEITAPAAGLFSASIARAPSAARPSLGGFLSEIERMPHFGMPSEESFVRNFLESHKGYFVTKP